MIEKYFVVSARYGKHWAMIEFMKYLQGLDYHGLSSKTNEKAELERRELGIDDFGTHVDFVQKNAVKN